MEDVELKAVELHTCGNDLGEEFPNCVQEADQSERFGNVILWLVRLRDDDACGRFEPRRPNAHGADAVEQVA